MKTIDFLKECECIGQTAVSKGVGDNTVPEERLENFFRPMIKYVTDRCNYIDLPASLERCQLFSVAARYHISFRELENQARALREAIEGDLKYRRFAFVTEEKGKIQDRVDHDWALVLGQFPKAKGDIHEAVDYYALDLNTACVFHLMRVAEQGLRALAKERRVKLPKNKPVEWAQWQEILTALRKKADEILQTWKVGPTKDRALSFIMVRLPS